MKTYSKLINKISSLIRFLRINLFVQQFRYKTMGWWFWIDLSASIIDRLKPIFDAYILGAVINEIQFLALQTEKSFDRILHFLVLAFTVRLLVQLYSYFHRRFDWYYSVQAMEAAIDKSFMNKLLYLNWEHIENPQMEKKINRTLNRAADYIRRLSELHIGLIVAFITLATTFTLAKAPTWIIVLSLVKEIPSIVLSAWGARLQHRFEDDAQYEWIKRGNIFSYFRQFPTLLEIKISRGHHLLLRYFDNVTIWLRQHFMKKDKRQLIPWLLTITYESIINISIFGYYIWQVVYNGMLLGTFQYTYNLISQIGSNIYNVMVRLTNSVEYYRYVSYAYDLLTLRNDRPDGTKLLKDNKITIEFKNVWFKYPGARNYSLKNINLTIEDNARLAIVGENGAGKTTLLKLINRLYMPTKGVILVNGIPTQDYRSDSYNSKIAVVTQDFARYSVLTVKQNIAVFGSNEHISMRAVRHAAELADAMELINKLPDKFDTYLTKSLEGGTELSTGQWQRIAVARQFYANRPLVILDEPTSAIDPIAEARIFENLYEHVKDKTVIVVSHRYNTVRAAKRILVFKDGQIIEQGSHSELLKMKGYYAKAFTVQQEKKRL